MKLARAACVAAWLLALVALRAQGGGLTLTARCSASCSPSPAEFAVPEGQKASSFRLLSLVPGKPCAGDGAMLSGFSIRRDGQTVFVHYPAAAGPVSDPVPLEDLSLPPGRYEVHSVPAKGASVRLSLELSPSG